MKIEYSAAVLTPAGFRQVAVIAEAERESAGYARVSRVLSIDGEAPAYGMSRTGANRQKYNGIFVAQREIGKRKRISALTIVGD